MTESYTYSSKQFKVIIKKINNLYSFSSINEDTNEFFQSEQTELKRISSQTLTAAFNDKVKNITNQIVYEDQSHIKIIIKVSLDFLPQFCQTILLNKVQKGEYQAQKIYCLEFQNQIKIVREQLEWLVNNKKILTFQKQSLSVLEDIILWSLELQKGDYLIQCCGMCLGQYNFDLWESGGNSQYVSNYVPKSTFEFQANLNKNCVYSIDCKPYDYSNYEYPYSFSFVLHVNSKSSLTIIVRNTNKMSGTLNKNNLTVQKIKPQSNVSYNTTNLRI